ncbi:Transcription factor IIIB 70 kDa subunit [Exophiala dermatitidis]|uniref:Transcription initiation factor TFIIB n=1 Tax=Exophiala dermatitidis (strain ATCC 34100 / CBS 525.76 / NIH/UT8656) TaxID=858893 RepID=H6CBL3_EXODN|nr:transcription initiation factor TFIIB [Exophiala dermatitidis NIH/UT8656]EHY61160.1 transcription initiation factor TFIIB [Exophiala dermatitidis NIH/UT8656]
MPPKAPPPKPRAGQHRKPAFRGRIEGLGSPAPPSLRGTTPTFMRASTPVMPRKVGPKTHRCTNPNCPDPKIVDSGSGGLICETCGAVAQEESGLVSEQGFGETDSGRITALGVHVGESQTHQRTYAAGGALGNAGREPTVNRDRSEAHARTVMLSYQSLLGVRLAEVEAGMQIFKLAWGNSFVQGRTIDSVAVVCLYLACRRKHEQIRNERRPMYSLMLIDFAEKLNIDVFALGKMYSDLVRRLYLQPDGSVQADVSADLLAMGPEVLVNRFVDELEFDREHRDKIKMDAIRIVQRMKRDWMSTGRRPSGVCGAAVILAARMNNYRRTTREVVLTAKVTEITINKRLAEFQDTASSKLSIKQFRDNQILDSLTPADPPSFTRGQTPQQKKKRGRPRKRPLGETAAEIEGDGATPEPAGQFPAKRVRIDADGYKIPELPVRREQTGTNNSEESGEPQDDQTTGQRRQRWKAPPASDAELAIENEIESEVIEALRENAELDPTLPVPESTTVSTTQQERPSTSSTAAQPIPSEDDSIADIIPLIPSGKDKTPGPAVNTRDGNMGHVSLSPTIRPDEFDSDEDVSTCLLTDEESRIKERVWVSMNADWLRQDHAKRIRRELKEAEMRAQGLDPEKEALRQAQARGRRKDGTKRPGRRGDVSYLKERDEAGGEGGDAGAEAAGADGERSAAESVRKMFKTRGVYSRRVNYDVLDSIYGLGNGGDSPSEGSRSRSQSVVSMDQGAREGSVASTVASNFDDSNEMAKGIFRGKKGRDGRSRSRLSSVAPEKKRKDAAAASSTPAPERSVSRSRSPSMALVEEPMQQAQEHLKRSESSEQLQPQQQLPTPRPTQTQSQGIPTISSSGTATETATASTSASIPPVAPPVIATSSTSHPAIRSPPSTNEIETGEEEIIGPLPGATAAAGQEEVVEEDDDDIDYSRLRGFAGEEEEDYDDDDDDDDDEDEDGDVDAAFEGRYASRGW